jgi:hypothetical protein
MSDPKRGNLATALATWVYSLEEAGHVSEDAAVRAACEALRGADPEQADLDQRGLGLVAAVREGLGGEEPSFEAVVAWAKRLYGAAHVAVSTGGDREERFQEARRAHFTTGLPWIARIIDRFPDGEVGPHWVLVERVTDRVSCLDPYPWDDLDEEYSTPLVEFAVKWELADSQGFRWVP